MWKNAAMTIVTVFRSRLRPGVESEYSFLADEMSRLVGTLDGFIEEKFYVASDGERVTIVRFADQASHEAWAQNPVHRRAQRRGRDEFYSWYSISIADERYHRDFSRVDE